LTCLNLVGLARPDSLFFTWTTFGMFITLQFPFVDLRQFLIESPYFVPARLSAKQDETIDLEGVAAEKFVRCFGHFTLRGKVPDLSGTLGAKKIPVKKKAYQPTDADDAYNKLPLGDIWQDEYLYASTRRALRFDHLEKQVIAEGKLQNPRVKVRAFRFSPYDPSSKLWSPCMRVETGILFDVPKPLEGNELIEALTAFAKLKTRVPVYEKEGAGKQAIVEKPIKLQQGTLIEQQKTLAKLIVNGTTAQNIEKVHKEMVMYGEPLLAVHYASGEIKALPSNVITLPKSITGDTTISYCPLKKPRLGIWLFGLPGANKKTPSSVIKREAARNNTIAIMRYWGELQAAVALRSAVLSDAFEFSVKENSLLQQYVNRATNFLFSGSWHGARLDMIRNIIDAHQAALPAKKKEIEKALMEFRKQVGEKFMKIGTKKPGIFVSYSHLDAAFLGEIREAINIHYQTEQINYFDDNCIKPGEEWDPKIKEALENTNIAVLLVSDNFLKSEYIQNIEKKKLIDLYQRRKTKIISLLLNGEIPKKGSLSNLEFLNKNKPFITCTPEEKQNILISLQTALKS